MAFLFIFKNGCDIIINMKAVIFDFNGTMIFDGPYHDRTWKEFSKQLRGFAMDDEEINRHVHGKVNEQIIAYLKPDCSKEENKSLSLLKESVYRNLCLEDKENYKLVDGLEEYMDYLKDRNIPFTIASASIKENIDFFVEVFNLDHWINPSMIVYDDGTHEDKKSMFLKASENLGVSIEECVIFEDSFTGIFCAKEIGAGKIIAIPLAQYIEEFNQNEAIAFTITNFNDFRIREVFK